MAPNQESFNLSLQNFEKSASDTFKDMFEDNHFADVTLATEDNRQIKAHKVVLSACSKFFKRILKTNPHQHPLLYLKGINYLELTSILKFVYKGKTEIDQNVLQSFLDMAKELEIKGLNDLSENIDDAAVDDSGSYQKS